MFKNILVPIDIQHEGGASRLLKQVGELAGRFDARVHVTTVIPGYGMPIVAAYFPVDAQHQVRREMESRLKAFVDARLPGRTTTSVSVGKRSDSILKMVRRRKPDLLIVGCRKHRPAGDMLLGSCSAQLATHSPCPVMTLRI